MLAVWDRTGRLPETYPMPIETWKFGDQLTMVFLGGEVTVDYAVRLKKEIDTKFLWVTAYANDVFAYVASDRVRHEGGYEADFSMIFYNQPGPWAATQAAPTPRASPARHLPARPLSTSLRLRILHSWTA